MLIGGAAAKAVTSIVSKAKTAVGGAEAPTRGVASSGIRSSQSSVNGAAEIGFDDALLAGMAERHTTANLEPWQVLELPS
ncbi:MAG: hypothetical protein WAZ15_03395 [Propioniciclava sp.]|jgi:hypothetical protein